MAKFCNVDVMRMCDPEMLQQLRDAIQTALKDDKEYVAEYISVGWETDFEASYAMTEAFNNWLQEDRQEHPTPGDTDGIGAWQRRCASIAGYDISWCTMGQEGAEAVAIADDEYIVPVGRGNETLRNIISAIKDPEKGHCIACPYKYECTHLSAKWEVAADEIREKIEDGLEDDDYVCYGVDTKDYRVKYALAFESREDAEEWLDTEEYDFRMRYLYDTKKEANEAWDLYDVLTDREDYVDHVFQPYDEYKDHGPCAFYAAPWIRPYLAMDNRDRMRFFHDALNKNLRRI